MTRRYPAAIGRTSAGTFISRSTGSLSGSPIKKTMKRRNRAENKRRRNLPPELLRVARAEKAAHQHRCPDADARHTENDNRHDGIRRADRRQRVFSRKFADNDGIDRIVGQLKDIPQNQWSAYAIKCRAMLPCVIFRMAYTPSIPSSAAISLNSASVFFSTGTPFFSLSACASCAFSPGV